MQIATDLMCKVVMESFNTVLRRSSTRKGRPCDRQRNGNGHADSSVVDVRPQQSIINNFNVPRLRPFRALCHGELDALALGQGPQPGAIDSTAVNEDVGA